MQSLINPLPFSVPPAEQAARPWVAPLKSLVLPGLGQWHNGQNNKAIVWFLAFAFVSAPMVALVALVVPAGWMAPLLALGLVLALGLWLGSVVDAWRVAQRPLRSGLATAAGDAGLARQWGVTLLIVVLCDFVALPLLSSAVRAHLVRPFRIPSASMAPTLWPGDYVFADMRYACVGCSQPVRRGDVAVFANPNDRTQLYVKRVLALPGDRVQVSGNTVAVNGAAVPDVQAAMPPGGAPAPAPGPAAPAALAGATDFTVPPGHLFVLGDQRAHSQDSRHFGSVPLQDVVGRVRQVWWSWGEGGVRWQRVGQVVR